MTSKSNASSFESLIMLYLNQRGYKNAEKVLRQELKEHDVSVEEYTASHSLEAHASIQNLIKLYNPEELSPDWYSESYRYLRRFIESSLDLYKDELLNVLFPLFMHIYLDLVAKGFPHDAAAFLKANRADHQKLYDNEIKAVVSLCYPHDIEKNQVAKRFREHKVDVPLSAFSHQLLISFLQEYKLYLLLKLLNEHVNLRIVSSRPLTGPSSLSSPTGQPDALNSTPIRWGKLKELRDLEKLSSFLADQPTKVEDSQIPLPTLSRVQRDSIVSDLKRCVYLDSASLPTVCFYTFLNCRHRLNRCAVSNSGQHVAAGFTDSSVKVWDLETSSTNNSNDKAFKTLIGHSAPVYGIDFSLDAEHLLTSSADHSVRLWSRKDAHNLVAYKGHNFPVWDVKFSPVDFYFATASNDRTARLWSTERIYPLRVFAGHLSDVDVVEFHPNCNYLVSGSSDKSIRVWDLQSGECVRLLTGHTGKVLALAVSPDGKMIASAGVDRKVCLWDVASGSIMQTFEGHEDTVRDLSFSREGAMLASGSQDQTIKMWDTHKAWQESQKLSVSSPEYLLKTFRTKRTSVQCLRFSSRNLLLASGCFMN